MSLLSLPTDFEDLSDNHLLSAVCDTAPVGLAVVDANVRLRRANRFLGELLQIDAQLIDGMAPGQAVRCVHRHDDPGGCGHGPACAGCGLRGLTTRALHQSRSSRRVHHTLVSDVDGEPRLRHLQVSAVPLQVKRWASPLALLAFEDVTDVRAHEQQLAEERVASEKLRALTETAAAVSHELSQPLQAVLGAAELAAVVDPEEQRQLLAAIRDNATRMASLLHKMQRITSYSTMDYGGEGVIIDLVGSSQAAPPDEEEDR